MHTIGKCLFLILLLSLSLDANGQEIKKDHLLFDMRHGLAQMKIRDIHQDHNGIIWIATRNGLSRFNGAEFRNYFKEDGLPSNRVLAVRGSSDGRLLILTSKGISFYDGLKFENFPYEFPQVEYYVFLDDHIVKVTRVGPHKTYTEFDLNEKKYIVKKSGDAPSNPIHRLFHEKKISNDTIDVSHHIALPQSLSESKVYLTVDKDSTFWYGSIKELRAKSGHEVYGPTPYSAKTKLGHGLFYTIKGGRASGVRTNGSPFSYETGSLTNDALQTTSNEIVVATESGLLIYPPEYFYSFENNSPPNAWAVIEHSDGRFFSHSFGFGIHTISPDLANVEEVQIKDTLYNGYFSLKSAKDAQGRIFFPAQYLVIFYENKFHTQEHHKHLYACHFDPFRDQMVIGTNDGIAIFEEGEYSHEITSKEGLHYSDYIYSISQDSMQRYWLGSYSGLSCYDPSSGNNIIISDTYPEALAEGAFGMWQEDTTLWLGLGDGLSKVNTQTLVLEKIESSVLKAMVKGIIQYNDSLLLIGAKDGLYFFNKKAFSTNRTIDIWPIYPSQGFTGIEPGFDCFYRDSKGRIWITASNHLSILTPNDELIKRNFLRPNIYSINDQKTGSDHERILYLARGQNQAVVNVEAIGVQRPAVVQYQYALDDKEWTDWSPDPKIVLNNLNHGRHSLQLRAGPSDLPPNVGLIDTVEFYIDLPIWRRLWFQWVMGIIIMGTLLFLGLRYFIAMRERKRYLRSVKENNYLKNQILLSELNPHFIFNALSSIQLNILKENKQKASEQVVRLSKLIRAFLNNSYRANIDSSETGEMSISLNDEIALLTYYLEFEKEKHNDKFDFSITLDESIDPDNTYLPPMILQPLVENSIKHGVTTLTDRPGIIDIRFKSEEEYLIAEVRDNGIGIDAARELKKKQLSRHESLGHKIIEERLRVLAELGYEINMTVNSNNQGTLVTIKIKDE